MAGVLVGRPASKRAIALRAVLAEPLASEARSPLTYTASSAGGMQPEMKHAVTLTVRIRLPCY